MANEMTVKQESFCMAYIELSNASEAYRLTYNTENMQPYVVNQEASALLKHPKISKKILELREQYRKDNSITIECITNGLKEAANLARANEDASNLRQAYMDMAKLHGLIVDKKIIEGGVVINKKRGEIAQRFVERFGKSKNKKNND